SHLNSKKFLRRWWHSYPGCAAGKCVVCPDGRENQQARSLLASVTQAGVSALACVLGSIGVGEQRFYFLFEQCIAGAGAFHKGGALNRIIRFDGIGQNCFHLLPAFRSHRSREGKKKTAHEMETSCCRAHGNFAEFLPPRRASCSFARNDKDGEVLRAFINLWICCGRSR